MINLNSRQASALTTLCMLPKSCGFHGSRGKGAKNMHSLCDLGLAVYSGFDLEGRQLFRASDKGREFEKFSKFERTQQETSE